MEVYALIGGGGTAGHVLPGIAVARELVTRGHDVTSIRFVGAERGSDASLVVHAGFEIDVLPGRGIRRSLSLSAMRSNLAAIVGIFRSMWRGVLLMRRYRPSVVVSVGGYASLACSFGAVVTRVPLVLMEQNAKAGAANRVMRFFAKASAVPFEQTDLTRAVVTGNPVRSEILAVDRRRDRASACGALGIDDTRTVIAVASGSLGSRRINDAVFEAAKAWRDRPDLAVYHVIGRRDFASTAAAREAATGGALSYQSVEYEDRMAQVYAACDLVIGRAGGSTVAELAVVGLPSVLVPLPIAPRDHQTANARALGDAAIVVADAEFTGERLVAVVTPLLDDPSRLAAMGSHAAALGHRDAAARVADLVESHARR